MNIVEEGVVEQVPPATEQGPHQSEPHPEPDQQQHFQAQDYVSTPSPLPSQIQAEVELHPSSTQEQDAATVSVPPAEELHKEVHQDPNTEAPLTAEPNDAPDLVSPTSHTSPETPSRWVRPSQAAKKSGESLFH